MDHRVSKDMISSGMSYSGNQSKEDLGRTQYGSVARPDVLMNAYQSMYSQDTEEVKEAKVDKKLPEHERSAARLARYDNPSGALALGGGQQRARRAEHKERRGVKKEEFEHDENIMDSLKKTYARLKYAPGYDPISGRTFLRNRVTRVIKPKIIVSRDGAMGTMEKGKPDTFNKIDPSDPDFKSAIERYRTLRGETQLQKDKEAVRASRIASLSPPDSRLDSPIAGPGPIGNRVGSKPVPVSATAPAAPRRPVTAPVVRPVPVAAARPVPVAATPLKPTPPAAGTPARPSLRSEIEDLQRMRAASLMRQQGRNLPNGKIPVGDDLKPSQAPPPAKPATPDPTPAPKPSALAQRVAGYKAGGPLRGPREKALNQSLDLFDIIKGHLLDEGYADTEQAALAIMANMSEEWKQSIVESGYFPSKESQVTDEAKYKLQGQVVKPRTTQTQSKSTPVSTPSAQQSGMYGRY